MKKVLIIFWFVLFFSGVMTAFVPEDLLTQHQWTGGIMPILIAFPTIFLANKFGIKNIGKILLIMGGFALFIETFGLLTGWPYGQFKYLDLAGWKIAGILPLSLPFAWVPLALAAYSLAVDERNFFKIIKGVLILLLFDLLIDPAAVEFGLWEYQNKTGFLQVPWSNFVGWLISGTIAMWIMEKLSLKILNDEQHYALRVSAGGMLMFWLGYWISKCLNQWPIWDNPEYLEYQLPVIFGIIAMAFLLGEPKKLNFKK